MKLPQSSVNGKLAPIDPEVLWFVQIQFCEPQLCSHVLFRENRLPLGKLSQQTTIEATRGLQKVMCKGPTFTFIWDFSVFLLCYWLPLVIPGKEDRITTHVAVSADLLKWGELKFLVRVMTSTFIPVLSMLNQCLPSSLCKEFFQPLPISSEPWRERCVASLLWSYVMYSSQHCSSTLCLKVENCVNELYLLLWRVVYFIGTLYCHLADRK